MSANAPLPAIPESQPEGTLEELDALYSAELATNTAIVRAMWTPEKHSEAPVPIDKRWQTLRARAALKGIVAVQSHDDRGRPDYIVNWFSLTRAFASLDELGAWLDRVEGRRT